MEETNDKFEEPKVRTKVFQTAAGALRYEISTRADTVEEALSLLKAAKKELEELCK